MYHQKFRIVGFRKVGFIVIPSGLELTKYCLEIFISNSNRQKLFDIEITLIGHSSNKMANEYVKGGGVRCYTSAKNLIIHSNLNLIADQLKN